MVWIEISNMGKEEIIICERCRREPIRVLSKWEIEYGKKTNIPLCPYCGSSNKLQIIKSNEELINKIERVIKNLEKNQLQGYKSDIRALEYLKKERIKIK